MLGELLVEKSVKRWYALLLGRLETCRALQQTDDDELGNTHESQEARLMRCHARLRSR